MDGFTDRHVDFRERKIKETRRSGKENNEHPVCRFSPDKEKCRRFVERLKEASDNIDRDRRHRP